MGAIIGEAHTFFIQIFASSGRLQFIDATGSIDVVVPDLPSDWDISTIYEVMLLAAWIRDAVHFRFHTFIYSLA